VAQALELLANRSEGENVLQALVVGVVVTKATAWVGRELHDNDPPRRIGVDVLVVPADSAELAAFTCREPLLHP